MSGFYGADTQQLRDHSELLRDRARTFSELRDRLQPAVMNESVWQGSDADAFRTDWSARTSSLFDEIAAQIDRHSADLETQAEEQDTASEARSGGDGGGDRNGVGGGGGGGGGGRGDTDSSSWLERLRAGLDLYNDAQSVFSKGHDVWKAANIIRDSARFLDGTQDIFQFLGGTWQYGQRLTSAFFSADSAYSGLAKKLAGKLNIPSGFGTRNFFSWVDNAAGWVGQKAPFLTDIAPAVGRWLPAVDVVLGGTQVFEGIREGDTFKTVTGGASMLGGGLMLAGGAMSATGVGAVAGGPLFLAGAVISGGAAVADLGRTVYENWDTISETASDAWNWAGDQVGSATDWAGDQLDTATDWAGDQLDSAADWAGDKVSDVAEGASNLWDGVSDAFSW